MSTKQELPDGGAPSIPSAEARGLTAHFDNLTRRCYA